MKALTLRKILNTTRSVGDYGKYIAVGSPLCHNLFSIDKETLTLSYALDTFNNGRDAIKSEEGELIWDTLQGLIDSGEIQTIINEDDMTPNPIAVYSYKDGEIRTQYCEEFGWPNPTLCGEIMYENTHFTDFNKALEDGKSTCDAGINTWTDRIDEIKKDLAKIESYLQRDKDNLAKLNNDYFYEKEF